MYKDQFANRSAGLVLMLVLMIGIGTLIATQGAASSAEGSAANARSTAPLDWYFANQHAVLDGDNNVLAAGAPASDYIQRHPELLHPENAVDLSDYYQRHPTVMTAANSAGADDYFQRHPELFKAPKSTDDSEVTSAQKARWAAVEEAYRKQLSAANPSDPIVARWAAVEEAYRKYYGVPED